MTAMLRGGRLFGKTLMLTAGLPAEDSGFDQTPLDGWDIDQAVIALARAVLAEGGRLVFEGDAALSTLVALISGEYQTQRFAESPGMPEDAGRSPVRVYRRGGRSERDAKDDELLARLRLVDFADEEPFEQADTADAPHWIARESPVALVCIGGDVATLEHSRVFAQLMPDRPIFALGTTGGAARRLAESDLPVERVDEKIVREVRHRMMERPDRGPRERDPRRHDLEKSVIPYPVIMQTIVDRIASGHLRKDLET